MKTALYFGSFNPIHVGHLIIANHIAQEADIKEVWLVISPHNPLKKKDSLLKDYHRLAMVKIAIEDNPKLRASDIEFSLPQPSYTINTLVHLEEQYPDKEFALIMGEDNLQSLHKWKNYEQILANYHIYVYPRIGENANSIAVPEILNHPNIKHTSAPILEISSSDIRNKICAGTSVKYMLTDAVLNYIDEMNFYKK